MRFYRVFPHTPGVAATDRGGALYVPPNQNGGRLDNAHLYNVLYVGDTPAGVIAEAFGRFAVWDEALFEDPHGRVKTLAAYEAPDDIAVCDLDDPKQLLAHDLKPSDVITRDYVSTRKWGARLFEARGWNGIRWWSYYEARWGSYGFWEIGRMRVVGLESLTIEHQAVRAAADVLGKSW